MRVLIVVAIGFLSLCRVPDAAAHDEATWIMLDPKTRTCCGPNDCRRMADGEVAEVDGGWTVLATGEHVAGITSKLRTSIDNHFWICRNDGPNGPGTADLRCLFVPKLGS